MNSTMNMYGMHRVIYGNCWCCHVFCLRLMEKRQQFNSGRIINVPVSLREDMGHTSNVENKNLMRCLFMVGLYKIAISNSYRHITRSISIQLCYVTLCKYIEKILFHYLSCSFVMWYNMDWISITTLMLSNQY